MTRYTAQNSSDVERVLFDGETVEDIEEADTELGFAVQLVRDGDRPAINADGSVQRRLLVGSVTVVLRNGMATA